jgi:hypothetical protein
MGATHIALNKEDKEETLLYRNIELLFCLQQVRWL